MRREEVEAVINNGQIERVSSKLPSGRIKAKLIYETDDGLTNERLTSLLRETSGVYKSLDADAVSAQLRGEWDRDHDR